MRTGSTTWYAVGFAAVLAGCSAAPEPEQPVVVAYAPPPVIVPEQPDPAAELDCLAKTVYFEARGENEKGQRAVAAVVLNRAKSSRFPDTICQVVHQGGTGSRDCQFSWWCDGLSDKPKDQKAWERAVAIARDMINGAPDPTNGALYFHETHVTPSWRTQLRRVATIGSHVYYR